MDYNIVDTIMILNEQCCHMNRIGGEEAALTSKEIQVLQSVSDGEQVSGSELARRNLLSPSRMSRIIERLSARGLLNRDNDDTDRRLSLVSLSPEGKTVTERASEFRKECESKIKSRLSDNEFAIIQKALHILSFAMENEYGIDDGPSGHH